MITNPSATFPLSCPSTVYASNPSPVLNEDHEVLKLTPESTKTQSLTTFFYSYSGAQSRHPCDSPPTVTASAPRLSFSFPRKESHCSGTGP